MSGTATSSENGLLSFWELPPCGGGFLEAATEAAECRMSRSGDFESHPAAALVLSLSWLFSAPQFSSTRAAGGAVRLVLVGKMRLKMPLESSGTLLRMARAERGLEDRHEAMKLRPGKLRGPFSLHVLVDQGR